MTFKSTYLIVVAVVIGFAANAQQLPESNLYQFNKYSLNPAYTGFNQNCLETYGSHLSQWVGIEGAPTTSYFSVHSGLGENMGLGGGIIFDQAAFVTRFSGRLSYAYRVKFGDDHNLRFGLSGGMYQVKIDATTATVDDLTDDVISGGAQSGMTFDSEFGIFYNYKGFQLGVSVPQIFETSAKLDFQDMDGFTGNRHIVGYTGYKWEANDTWAIEPSVMFKTAGNGLSQIDFNAMVTYNNLISLGGGYRTHIGPMARLGINIKDQFLLAYAYEFSGANISAYSNGSHEIMLGIKFCRDQKAGPVASIISAPVVIPEEVVEEPVIEEPVIDQPVVEPDPIVDEPIIDEPVKNEITEQEKKAFDINVQFPVNNSDLSSKSNTQLNELVKLMKKYPEMNVKVLGHSCDKGGSVVKLSVSKERANEVQKYLVKNGIAQSRINSVGASDTSPLVPNNSESNRQKNRRVEIQIVE
ncbi:MAG: type IX secretion system PorP/SprF family membrane protein [Parvicellaceae bacterium]|jgi:type IX secretion system PorP/SprF family membrane protein